MGKTFMYANNITLARRGKLSAEDRQDLAYYLRLKIKDRIRSTKPGEGRDGWINVLEELLLHDDVDSLLNVVSQLVRPASVFREAYLKILTPLMLWQAEFLEGRPEWPVNLLFTLRRDLKDSDVNEWFEGDYTRIWGRHPE